MSRRIGLIVAALLVTQCRGSAQEASAPDGSLERDAPWSAATDDASTALPDAVSIEDTAAIEAAPLPVEASPESPADDAGKALPWTVAPRLGDPTAVRGRDHAILIVPAIDGARDYRVFAVPSGVVIESTDSVHESVRGTTIFCAGYRQRNAPAAAPELLRRIEVVGLAAETRLVVEAIDTPCPFPGVQGAAHADVAVTNVEVEPAARGTFSIFTESEIVAAQGSMILNGQGPAAKAGQPAEPIAPKVLARTTIKVGPQPSDPPTAFFEDFGIGDPPEAGPVSAVADPIAFVSELPVFDRTQRGKLYRNSKFLFATYGAENAQFFVDRRRLNVVLADWGQDIMASAIVYPRRPVQVSSSSYLHVTFRVPSDSTQRRYWWLFLCGADAKGKTIDASGNLLGNVIQTPFFYQTDGLNPSVEGWNCLQVFPRDGAPYALAGGNPESDVRVMVNKAGALARDNVVDVSPDQYGVSWIAPSWYRQQDAKGTPGAAILDDQLLLAPAARFDLWIRRDRVILYVEGEQRLCNDFPSSALTMAEGALGFGQVLYHSAAERQEFSRTDWLRTGQRHYLQNTPFVDVRQWDDLGYSEGVAAPADFAQERCHVAH